MQSIRGVRASGIERYPARQEELEKTTEDTVRRTVLLSLRTTFLFTRAIRHLFTRAWLRSGGFTNSRTTCLVST